MVLTPFTQYLTNYLMPISQTKPSIARITVYFRFATIRHFRGKITKLATDLINLLRHFKNRVKKIKTAIEKLLRPTFTNDPRKEIAYENKVTLTGEKQDVSTIPKTIECRMPWLI